MFRVVAITLLLLSASSFAEDNSVLELSDCRISVSPGSPGIAARCGMFARPLNPMDEHAGTIDLKVAVIPALSLEPATDPFVPIAGGPGQSTIQFYAGWTAAFERIRQDRDILLLDQRGTGDSAPMTCELDEDAIDGK